MAVLQAESKERAAKLAKALGEEDTTEAIEKLPKYAEARGQRQKRQFEALRAMQTQWGDR